MLANLRRSEVRSEDPVNIEVFVKENRYRYITSYK